MGSLAWIPASIHSPISRAAETGYPFFQKIIMFASVSGQGRESVYQEQDVEAAITMRLAISLACRHRTGSVS